MFATEWTLNRLLDTRALISKAPARPRSDPPKVGQWLYFQGTEPIVSAVKAQLEARLPHTQPSVLGKNTLVLGGSLATLGEIGLGFDPYLAQLIQDCGLQVVPRPVSYPWPEVVLIERTIAQAGTLRALPDF